MIDYTQLQKLSKLARPRVRLNGSLRSGDSIIATDLRLTEKQVVELDAYLVDTNSSLWSLLRTLVLTELFNKTIKASGGRNISKEIQGLCD